MFDLLNWSQQPSLLSEPGPAETELGGIVWLKSET